MSVEIIRLLNCDGEDCPSGEAFDPSADCTPVAEQRKLARKLGWLVNVKGGKDYCPACREEAKHP